MSRSVWANPNPVLSNDGRQLRLFFSGRNVDNRNRVDPVGAPGFPTSPLSEAVGFAVLRPDGLFGLHAGCKTDSTLPRFGLDRALTLLRGWQTVPPIGVSRTNIAGIWVAFFSRCQRYSCGQVRS